MKGIVVHWLAVLAVAGWAGTANASLIDNGAITSDSASGLDWLDLSVTKGRRISEALSENPGWQLPSYSQINVLLDQFFLGLALNSTDYVDVPAGSLTDQSADRFRELFGITLTEISFPASYGVYRDAGSIWRMAGAASCVSAGSPDCNPNGSRVFRDFGDYDGVYGTSFGVASYIGVYLIRQTQPVPAPTSLALFGLGLAGLGYRRRQLKKA